MIEKITKKMVTSVESCKIQLMFPGLAEKFFYKFDRTSPALDARAAAHLAREGVHLVDPRVEPRVRGGDVALRDGEGTSARVSDLAQFQLQIPQI